MDLFCRVIKLRAQLSDLRLKLNYSKPLLFVLDENLLVQGFLSLKRKFGCQ